MSQPFETKDGSTSLFSEKFDEPYHSRHGAIQESQHVFIDKGLRHFYQTQKPSTIDVFEMGFGTGLNALLTLQWAQEKNVTVGYTTIEKFPLDQAAIQAMNYPQLLQIDQTIFQKLHDADWEKQVKVSENFALNKSRTDLEQAGNKFSSQSFDLIYFDAFAPSSQPQLWETPVFEAMHQLLKSGGMLTTYCAKGQVRRNMQAAGFSVEKVPGPPGKREMLRATK